MLLLIEIGIRESELCALRLTHWNEENSIISVKYARNVIRVRGDYSITSKKTMVVETPLKNLRYRTIEISNEANRIIKEIINVSDDTLSDDHLLINTRGNPYNPNTYDDAVKRIYSQAGLEHISGAHILRRTCATKMYDNGCRIADIARYLGDTEEVIKKYYIATKKTIKQGERVLNVVPIPQKYYTPREDS